jgi:hypothetical protein
MKKMALLLFAAASLLSTNDDAAQVAPLAALGAQSP